LHSHAEHRSRLANPLVETQELESGDGGASDKRRSQMKRVERSNRFARKTLPGTFDDLWPDAEDVPVGGSGRQVGPAIGSVGLGQLAKGGGSKQNSVTLNKREI
jgi:hypothetical protein